MKSELARRLFAGLWFAAAAAIPVGLSFLLTPMSSGTAYKIVTTAASIGSALIFGLWLGAGILDEKKTKSAMRAGLRGLAIAALSYLLLFIIELYVAVLYNGTSDSDAIFRLIYGIAIMFLFGLLFFGWLMAAVGAAAGWLLYLFQIKPDENGVNKSSHQAEGIE